MPQYPIIATVHEIWAINPGNKQRLKIGHAKNRVLDLYTSNRCIYHANETIAKNSKSVSRGNHKVTQNFDFNYVTIYDTISGKSVRTAYPDGQQSLPMEERLMELDFSFFKDGDSLKYQLNGVDHLLFEKINGSCVPDETLIVEGNRVYYDGKRIVKFDQEILHFGVVDAREFQRIVRRKNQKLYKRLKSFV